VWTYIVDTTVGAVRLRIGDTTAGAPVDETLQDEEIEAIVLAEAGTASPSLGGLLRAAAECADALAAKFIRREAMGPDRTPGPTRSQELRATAARLRARAVASGGAQATAGGLAEITTPATAKAPIFRHGMMDNV